MQISIELDPFGAVWKEDDPYSSDYMDDKDE
jgi:hypothetical protein